MGFNLWFIGLIVVVFLVSVGGVVDELDVWIWNFIFGYKCLNFCDYRVIRFVRVLEFIDVILLVMLGLCLYLGVLVVISVD